MKKIHNFSPGPCILPQEVFKQAAAAVLELDGSGLSLLEISHRSKAFVDIMEHARSLVKELLGVPEGYEVLFLQGGASLGFYITACNFLKQGGKAAYINTGSWSSKAIKEAELLGDVEVLASSKDKNFSYIPKSFDVPEDANYLHYTSNNTIFGTQFHHVPSSPVPLVCDMSSDIFSKPIDVSKFALIYAGAQKNLGPAGTTLYIVKTELLEQTERAIPSMLNLQKHIKSDSMFNTPPVFPIYVSMLTMQWLKKIGGVAHIESINKEKAELLYSEIDENPLFEGIAATEDRSRMNATFVLADATLENDFNAIVKESGINGLKGHRSVGGYRASLYNALPVESVKVLVEAMKQLRHKFANA